VSSPGERIDVDPVPRVASREVQETRTRAVDPSSNRTTKKVESKNDAHVEETTVPSRRVPSCMNETRSPSFEFWVRGAAVEVEVVI
jgi:hypothetical protein